MNQEYRQIFSISLLGVIQTYADSPRLHRDSLIPASQLPFFPNCCP